MVRLTSELSSSGAPSTSSRQPATTSRGVVAVEEDEAAEHGRPDRMQCHLHRRHHAEVAATTAQAPEELGVVVRTGLHHRAVGGHHLGGEQVVAGQAVGPHEVADAAAEREAAEPGGRDQAAGGGQAMRLCGGVEPGPLRPAAGGGSTCRGIHLDGVHRRQVDDDAVVARRESGDAVRAAAHGDRQAFAGGEAHGAHHVGGPGGSHHHRRALVDRAVPDVASFLVRVVARPDQRAVELALQLVDRCFTK